MAEGVEELKKKMAMIPTRTYHFDDKSRLGTYNRMAEIFGNVTLEIYKSFLTSEEPQIDPDIIRDIHRDDEMGLIYKETATLGYEVAGHLFKNSKPATDIVGFFTYLMSILYGDQGKGLFEERIQENPKIMQYLKNEAYIN